MSKTSIAQIPRSAFGADNSENEDHDLFTYSAVVLPAVDAFLHTDSPLRIACALKGMGKSALLRIVRERVSQNNPSALQIVIDARDIVPSLGSVDPNQWRRDWKEAVYRQIAAALGSQINAAISDDQISLVEVAESQGHKRKNLIGTLLGRVKWSAVQTDAAAAQGIDKKVQREIAKSPDCWVYIDDHDDAFTADRISQASAAGFLLACQSIVQKCSGIQIRTTLRPTTWQIIHSSIPSLSHIDQHVDTISWKDNRSLVRQLLSRRCEYLAKRYLHKSVFEAAPRVGIPRQKYFIEQFFEGRMAYERSHVEPHLVLGGLTWYRPRWLIKLCNEALLCAKENRHPRIFKTDIDQAMKKFSAGRISDIKAEFRAQCESVGDLINTFKGQRTIFTPEELKQHIQRRVVNQIPLQFDAGLTKADTLEIMRFLYYIGFITARVPMDDGGFEHYTFDEQPDLLGAGTQIDGVVCEIHPVFRDALELKRR